jgi:hypothetical protein
MYFLIIVFAVIVIAALITIDNDLRLLKQKQYQAAIDHSRFLRFMELILNKYLVWRFWKKAIPVALLVILALAGIGYFYIRYALPKVPPVPERLDACESADYQLFFWLSFVLSGDLGKLVLQLMSYRIKNASHMARARRIRTGCKTIRNIALNQIQ